MPNERSLGVAFTGHRYYAGAADEALRRTIRNLYDEGFRHFWCGMAAGFDLAAGEAVIALRPTLPGLRLCCAIPHAGQAARFTPTDRARHAALRAAADRVEVLATHYVPDCYLTRNRYMVDRAACLVAWFDGSPGGTAHTVACARQQGLRVVNLWCDPQGVLPF